METATMPLVHHLKKYFGFTSFKGQQEKVIQSVLDRHDTFVIMPTGGGKSMCYQLPALIMDGTAIVVSPLIALMKNQVDAIRGFSSGNHIAHFMNSSLNKTELTQVKNDLEAGKTKLLYVAPETLTKQANIDFFKTINISFFAIDEAHCISEWGHDFRPEYRRLRDIIEAIDRVPIIALTATATPKVQQDIQKNLGMADANTFKASFNRANLYYEVNPKQEANTQIVRFINQNRGKSGIVYCLSRKKVEELAETLQVNGIKALPYHAGLDAATRAKHQDMFLMEEADVIVATIAFGMGIDKPDVRFVVHHDIPKSLEGYYQETGRAGRDGGEGKCVAFYAYKDIEKLEKFLQGKPVAEQEIGRQLIFETVSYAETAVCRRKQLLHYFGEDYEKENCGNCDNCLNPREEFEGEEDVKLLLNTILELKENFKTNFMASFLSGKETSEIKSLKHDQHKSFGAGEQYDEIKWNSIIRQCIIKNLLIKEIENYGILKVSDSGHEFLKKPYSIPLVEPKTYDAKGKGDAIQTNKGGGAADEKLYRILKDLCKEVAREEDLPPYVIFSEPSLEDMATRYPITMDELTNITGVGQGKAEKFGEPFLEAIQDYVEEHEIERPDDLVVKSVVNKSGLKVYIIQSIDRKLPLEDIAGAKGKTVDEILGEMENIVTSGTRINLDYILDDLLDEEYQEEIFDYFRDTEEDDIEEAVEEFDGVYSEEELRMMRIKFLSIMGN
jgi:ATP-dependent DNA helicase RecQ